MQYPQLDYPFADNEKMKITDKIAANLSAWMESNPSLDTIKKVAIRSQVGFGTVQRAKNGDGNPTIVNLQDIANAFGKPVEALLAEQEGSRVQQTSATYMVEAITPERLQEEVVKMLAAKDIDDQNVWVATIIAAANKARRSLGEEERRVLDKATPDPNRDRRHA